MGLGSLHVVAANCVRALFVRSIHTTYVYFLWLCAKIVLFFLHLCHSLLTIKEFTFPTRL